MKNKLTIALISALFIINAASAEYSLVDSSDFTGESFFKPSVLRELPQNQEQAENDYNGIKKPTTPPIKLLREKIQASREARIEARSQLAPTDPNASIYNSEKDTSDYVSKEVEEDFDENMMPDGFEADEEAIKEYKKSRHFWLKNKESISENKENRKYSSRL